MTGTPLDELLSTLGINESLREKIRLPLQPEASELIRCEKDMFDREQFMTPHTNIKWIEMKSAAMNEGVELQLVSAFRSIEYQCNLIRNKLEKGQSIDEILKVNAAPGYSEHHTGRALDLNTPDCDPLTEDFETTKAFSWLATNAGRFSFSMTYPRDNQFGITYEPWHWACATPD